MKNIQNIINRLMESCNYQTEGILASKVGETVAGFSNKKKTGTILNKLLLHGAEKGLNIEWLRTGDGNKYISLSKIAESYQGTKQEPAQNMTAYDMLLRALQDQITVLMENITSLKVERAELIGELKQEQKRCWDRINSIQSHAEKMDETLDKINLDVGRVKNRMLDAARTGDIHHLEKISDAG